MRQQQRQDLDLRTFEINGTKHYAVQLEDFPKYWASTSGHIISTCYSEPRVLAGRAVTGGYLQVKLANNGEDSRKDILVHRLIAFAFYEEPDDDRDGNPRNQINHIDGIPTNNKTCNLEFTSRRENMDHCYQILPHIRDHFQGVAHA
jgi:hypothetical protein